jgi:hypothetical protein
MKVWKELLSVNERRKLGNNLDTQYWKLGGALGIWMKLRSMPAGLAIIDLADRLYSLVPDEKRRLLAALGVKEKDVRPRVEPLIPRWNRKRGELSWDGRSIRRVRIFEEPSHIQLLLDAFERQSWPDQIADPLFGGKKQQQLHQVVFSLNRAINVIRFHVHEGGKAVSWSVAATTASMARRSSRRKPARRAASRRRG